MLSHHHDGKLKRAINHNTVAECTLNRAYPPRGLQSAQLDFLPVLSQFLTKLPVCDQHCTDRAAHYRLVLRANLLHCTFVTRTVNPERPYPLRQRAIGPALPALSDTFVTYPRDLCRHGPEAQRHDQRNL
jgi:hypothetical protein